MRGWLDAIRQSSEAQRLRWGYLGLQQAVEFFNIIRILDFNETAINCYAELKKQKIRIGTQDLRIASIAISNNGILVTRNQRDFPGFLGYSLKIGRWRINAIARH
jgi:tRNA(fMet)-specific endonuclease VapC